MLTIEIRPNWTLSQERFDKAMDVARAVVRPNLWGESFATSQPDVDRCISDWALELVNRAHIDPIIAIDIVTMAILDMTARNIQLAGGPDYVATFVGGIWQSEG